MQTAAESNLAFTFISSFNGMASILPTIEKLELNQQISQALIRSVYHRQSLHLLAERLIAIADQAYPLRQMEAVKQASDLLLSLPLPREFKSIACYYKAICLKQRGQIDEARILFEQVAEETSSRYKARAILGLGTLAFDRGDLQSATPFYIEGSRAIRRAKGFDPLAVFYTQSAFAILKSIDGDHKGALADWEGMLPLVRAVGRSYPPLYYNHLNSLAVELLEAGRVTEARNVSNIVIASPFANTFPQYHETSRDIALRERRASRSVVAIHREEVPSQEDRTLENPVNETPSLKTDEQPSHHHLSSKLLLFRGRAFQVSDEPLYSHLEAIENQQTLAQKRARAIDIAHKLDEANLDRLLEFASSLDYIPAPPRKPREVNLEEKSTLEQLMTLWVNGDFGPDDFAAVMSALRDCDNDLRRNTIIDQMISYSFYFTQARMEGEDFWRKRVEARLTPPSD